MKDRRKLLYPLDEFYAPSGWSLPAARPFRGEEIPEPYRQILVHNRDMTGTLEAFHQEPIHLRVLALRHDGESLQRQVVLRTGDSHRPVEFAAIVIYLKRFAPAAREEILEGRRPFGAILKDRRIEHQGSPLLYLRVLSDDVINAALHLTQPHPLYGRRNVIRDASGSKLAETLEILPPAGTSAATKSLLAGRPATWPHATESLTPPFANGRRSEGRLWN
jgi:chorismate-pyruvate lyase